MDEASIGFGIKAGVVSVLALLRGTSALSGDVGDVEGEARGVSGKDAGRRHTGRGSRTRTQPGASLDALNAANVAGRGTNSETHPDG